MVRRSHFFEDMQQLVVLRRIIDKDGRNAREETLEIKDALVSTSGQTLAPNAATLPEGSIRVFLKERLDLGWQLGDKLSISSVRDPKDFIYTIQLIDTNVAGANARRYKTRIEARRKV